MTNKLWLTTYKSNILVTLQALFLTGWILSGLIFRDAAKHCESLNMSLWSPDLSSMYVNIKEYRASIFWTGFRRLNNSFFYEKSSHNHLSCHTGFLKSQQNKELDFSDKSMIKINIKFSNRITIFSILKRYLGVLANDLAL